MIEYIVRPVNSMWPIATLDLYKVSSLVRSNILWNVMMVNKAFFKFIGSSFGRSIVDREGKFTSRVSVCHNENKVFYLP